jgi:aryl-alcohol dehydrogenase-like predicted oxidoreductase
MGLGGGGYSRLGMSRDKSEAESLRIIAAAVDGGVNFIDTAEAYKSESLIGKGIRGIPRDKVVLSSKKTPRWGIEEADIVASLDQSLRNLGTDYIDVYHLHGITADEYQQVTEKAIPVLDSLRRAGKIRFLGITERFEQDTSHRMLEMALRDNLFDVVMVGFNLINHSARKEIFKLTRNKNVGVLNMFAVRNALSIPERFQELLVHLKQIGQVDSAVPNSCLDEIVEEEGAGSVTEMAYRFCKYEPGVDLVLSGTSNIEHLQDNLRSLQLSRLTSSALARIKEVFGDVDSVSGS